MVEQIGGFVDELLPILGHGGQRHFNTFLTYLLGDTLGPFAVEAGGVAGGRIGPFAGCQHLFQLCQKTEWWHRVAVKAGGRPFVTGGADGVGGDQQGVLIAVGADGHELEHIARAFALGPKPLFAAAKEGDLTGSLGLFQRFTGHKALHQHLTAGGVLDDGGDHAIAFFPVELLGKRARAGGGLCIFREVIHGWRLLRFSASVSIREWG